MQPNNPHAIVQIERAGFTDGQSSVKWDSFESKGLIKTVNVDLVTNESSQGEWKLFDPNFKVIDAFAGVDGVPQSIIRIYLGYGADLGEPVFKGLLVKVRREESDTVFTAYDMAFKMKLEKKAGYKNKKDDLGIINDLVTRNGLKFEGPDTPLKLEPHKAMMQDEQTDWEHVAERAKDAGLVFYVRQDTLFAKYPAKVGTPVLTVRNRKDRDLLTGWNFEFKTPEHRDGKPKIVKHRARGKAGKRIEGESNISMKAEVSHLLFKRDTPGNATKSKLSKRAQAQKDLEREHAFEGVLRLLYPTGKRLLDVRDTIATEGFGKLFSGKYICDTVHYAFEPGRLSAELDLFRDVKE